MNTLSRLYKLKDIIMTNKNNVRPEYMITLIKEENRGNPKAIANLDWINQFNILFFKYEKMIIDGKEVTMDFSKLGNIPYPMSSLFEDDNIQPAEIDHMLIVEFLYDPKGKDTKTTEWMVLYNPTDEDVCLDDWRIQVAGSIFRDNVTLSGVCKSKEYFKITNGLVMQNGGKTTDAVRLINEFRIPIDTVLYTKNNDNLLADDINSPSVSFAEDVSPGSSLIRIKENNKYIDTNSCGKDFIENTSPDISIY